MVPNTASLKPNGDMAPRMMGSTTRVHLCEPCFFRVLSGLRRERMVNGMFDDDQPFASENFGLVSKDNYWEKN